VRQQLDVLRSYLRYAALTLDDGGAWEIRPWGMEGEFRWPFARGAITTPTTSSGPAWYGDVTVGMTLHCYPVPQASAELSLIEVERVKELLYVGFEIGCDYTDPILAGPDVTDFLAEPGGILPAGSYLYAVTALGHTGETTVGLASGDVVPNGSSCAILWEPLLQARGYRVYRSDNGGPFGMLVELGLESVTFIDSGVLLPESLVFPPAVSTATVKVKSGKRRMPLYDYAGVPLDGLDAFSVTRHPSDYVRVVDHSLDHDVDPEDDTQFRVVSQLRCTWRRRGVVPSGRKLVREVRIQTTEPS
jgi:hypothetical protein